MRAQGSPGARGGRPCPPAFVKGLHRLGKAIELVVSEAVGEEGTFASYSPAKALALLGTLDGQMEALAELRGRVLAEATACEGGEGMGEGAGDKAQQRVGLFTRGNKTGRGAVAAVGFGSAPLVDQARRRMVGPLLRAFPEATPMGQ